MKTKLTILILFITTVCYSQSVIKPTAYFETGHENSRNIIYLPDNKDLPMVWNDIYAYYGKFYVSGEYKHIKVSTSAKTWFNKNTDLNYFNLNFAPIQSEFKIEVSYSFKCLMAGYKHDCIDDFDAKKTSYSCNQFYVRVYLTKK